MVIIQENVNPEVIEHVQEVTGMDSMTEEMIQSDVDGNIVEGELQDGLTLDAQTVSQVQVKQIKYALEIKYNQQF